MIHQPSSIIPNRGLIGKVLEMAKEAGNEKLEVIGSKMCIAYLENLVFVSWPLKVDGRWPWGKGGGKVALEGRAGSKVGLECGGGWKLEFFTYGEETLLERWLATSFYFVHLLGGSKIQVDYVIDVFQMGPTETCEVFLM